jgi:hypothetical protein
MNTISYPLRVPREILALAKLRAKDEYVDQSTALRQLLHLGAEEYILGLVEKGRISVGRAAELLKTSVQDIYRLAEKHDVHVGATETQQEKSKETLHKLLMG